MSFQPNYRPDIDGLRALAIAGVLLFHVDENWLPGGFVGVDVFFVISGYLITGIISRELATGSFSLAGFYERRIRRILPALLVLLLVVLIAGWILMLPTDFQNLGKSMRYSILSFSNLHFMKRLEDYFFPEDVDMPLLHTWSLSVEEQFYLIFPLLMAGLFRWVRTKGRILMWMTGLAAASLIGSEIVVRQDAGHAFFLLPWRAWELLLGGILAIGGGPVLKRQIASGLGISGLLLILGAMVAFDGRMRFPGIAAMVPCAGAAMVILAGRQELSASRKIMGWRPFVGLGLISYSVYLWHWPLISFTAYLLGRNHAYGPVIVIGSLVLGWLSWKFVEMPFRRNLSFGRVPAFAAVAGVAAAVCLTEQVIRFRDGFPGRFSKEALSLVTPDPLDWEPPEHQTVKAAKGLDEDVVAVWGDSHAEMLGPALDQVSEELDLRMVDFAKSAHPPLPEGWAGPASDSDASKREFASDALDALKADPTIDVVVLACRWWNRLGVYLGGKETKFADLSEVVESLVRSGKRVVLVHPVPEVPIDVPNFYARRMKWGLSQPEFLPESEESRRWNPEVERYLWGLESIEGVSSFYPRDWILKEGRIDVRSGAMSNYRDEDHLSPAGALLLAKGLRAVLADSLARGPLQAGLRR